VSMDGVDSADRAASAPDIRNGLLYPCGEPPEPGTVKEVADGVLWVRMPLPFALKWINLWLLRDGDGWAIVDTGVALEETRAYWRTIIEDVLGGAKITRVFVTHMHPDHVGLAGWLTRKYQCRLWMSRLEYISCRMLVADTGREAPDEGTTFYQQAGWSEDSIDTYRVRFGGFGKGVSRMPDAYRRLSDGETIDIGGREWAVIMGCGHSPEHACLYQKDLSVLISGDQVLPRISSNVSIFPTEPDADPLTDWLDSCRKLRGLVPDETFILPAHNEPFVGVQKRLTDLIEGHEIGLSRILDILDEPKRVVDTFSALFKRPIGPDILGMATGEAGAHLNTLRARGLIDRTVGEDGVARYART